MVDGWLVNWKRGLLVRLVGCVEDTELPKDESSSCLSSWMIGGGWAGCDRPAFCSYRDMKAWRCSIPVAGVGWAVAGVWSSAAKALDRDLVLPSERGGLTDGV